MEPTQPETAAPDESTPSPAPPSEPPAVEEEEDPLLRMTVMNIVSDEAEDEKGQEAAEKTEQAAPAEDVEHQEKTAASAASEPQAAEAPEEEATEVIEQAAPPSPQPPSPPAHEEAEASHPAPTGFDEDEDEGAKEEPQAKAPLFVRPFPPPEETEDEQEEEETYEPSFVVQARRRQRRSKILRIFMSLASVVLLLTLAAQSAYVFRTQLAAWFPQSKPLLAQFCQITGCRVKLPAQIDMVSIESTELQAVVPNKNVFALNVLLRNRSALAQAWPDIELTLNDGNEQAVARRVLLPREYLPSAQDIAKGFGANSEQPIKLNFELAQVKASGYRVYLFYP
jgi:hypothetical protein